MTAQELLRQRMEAFNRHDTAAFASFYTPEAQISDPGYPEPMRGREAVLQDIHAWLGAFPDAEWKLGRTFAEGADHACEWTFSGTHNGPLPTPDGGQISPTQKKVRMTGAFFARIDAQGRIAEERRYFDLAGLLHQLGLG